VTESYLVQPDNPDDVKPPFHYKACGLDNVYLFCGYEIENYNDEEFVSVHDVPHLHREIGRVIANKTSALSSKEVRFLRSEMNITQSELGVMLGVDAQTVARYEKLGQTDIQGPAERLLRAFYLDHIRQKINIIEFVNTLSKLDSTPDTELGFSFDDANGWMRDKAAVGC